MAQFTIISLTVTRNEIARLHRAGCQDIEKDSRGHGDVTETIEAETASEAAAKYIAGDLADMGYTVADVKIINCAKTVYPTQAASAAMAQAIADTTPCHGKWSRCGGANVAKNAPSWNLCQTCTDNRAVEMRQRAIVAAMTPAEIAAEAKAERKAARAR